MRPITRILRLYQPHTQARTPTKFFLLFFFLFFLFFFYYMAIKRCDDERRPQLEICRAL